MCWKANEVVGPKVNTHEEMRQRSGPTARSGQTARELGKRK